jgi:hypothetical protein
VGMGMVNMMVVGVGMVNMMVGVGMINMMVMGRRINMMVLGRRIDVSHRDFTLGISDDVLWLSGG